LIDENPQGLFLDEFDHTPGASVYGVLPQGQDRQFDPASCPQRDAPRSATLEAFSDILEPMIASGLVLVDGARFVVDPTIGSARLSIAWQTLNICLRVAEEIEADYGVAAVQLSHIKLYQKIYNFTQIAEPRDYCQLNTKLRLIQEEGLVDLRG
jgi:hypothetical protein